MSTTVKHLGFIPKNRGEYTSGTRYYKDNIVQYHGSSYIANPTASVNDGNAGTQQEPLYYLTRVPFDDGSLSAGWNVFASGNNVFSTGESVTEVGIDSEPTAGSSNLVESGGVAEQEQYAFLGHSIFTLKGYKRGSNGELQKNSYYNATPLILLSNILNNSSGITIETGTFRVPSGQPVACFYDSNKEFVNATYSSTTFSAASPFPSSEIPDSAVYVSFVQYLSSNDVILKYYGVNSIKTIAANTKQTFGNSTEYVISQQALTNERDRIISTIGIDVISVKSDSFPKQSYYNFSFANIKMGNYRVVIDKTIYGAININKNVGGTVSTIIQNYNPSVSGNAIDFELTEDANSILVYLPANVTSSMGGEYSASLYYGNSVGTQLQDLDKEISYLDGIRIPVGNIPVIVSPSMSASQFITAINGQRDSYSTLCKCFNESFFEINSSVGWSKIFNIVNKNLRKEVFVDGRDYKRVCDEINYLFTQPIYRFCDAKLGGVRDMSINTNFQADEPSAIVSEDGSTLYVYAHLKRISTTDGLNWSQPENIVLGDGGNANAPSYLMHVSVNIIDGTYYLIGPTVTSGGNLHLFTSTDGLNFTYKGILFESTVQFRDGVGIGAWGNPFLMYEPGMGKFILYIETKSTGESWVINAASCTDILHENVDGTIGDWVMASNNPIIIRPYDGLGVVTEAAAQSAGNPDIARGCDNRPIKVNGKYYMYIHSTWKGIAHINRMSSYDLFNWEFDGVCFDNRDQPTGGDATSGNADHTLIEFKGRTYMFYTWDINNSSVHPYIKYTVDDRPFYKILELLP